MHPKYTSKFIFNLMSMYEGCMTGKKIIKIPNIMYYSQFYFTNSLVTTKHMYQLNTIYDDKTI
jgi:hypothetical protein